MMFLAGRRSSLGVCFAVVFLLSYSYFYHILHQAPLKGVNKEVQENPISIPQNHNGQSLMMNGNFQEDVRLQGQETAGEEQKKRGNGLKEESVSLGKGKNEMPTVINSKPREISAGKSGGSNVEKSQDGVVIVNDTKTPKLSSGRVYLADEELQDLQLKSKITTKDGSTNETNKKVVNIFGTKIEKYFANVSDINFIPGEVIPMNRIRHILIASNWRSGSSFLGNIVSAYPGTFYTPEPLHHYSIRYFQTGHVIPEIIKLLKDIFTCNFTPHTDYMDYMKLKNLLHFNEDVWNSCGKLCIESQFLSQICRYLPVNVMKTVRLGLTPIEQLLQDPSLDIRVIHLIRDPRGSLHSRRKRAWCSMKDCIDPRTLCNNLLTDLQFSKKYATIYTDRFLQVRYEDLSMDPESVAREIFRFVGLDYHHNVEEFVKSNTWPTIKSDSNQLVGPATTFKDPKTMYFAWREKFTFKQVDDIQRTCKDVLRTLGYTYFRTAEEFLQKNISVFT